MPVTQVMLMFTWQLKCHYIFLMGYFSEGLIVRFIIWHKKLVNVVVLWNKVWSFIEQSIRIGVIEKFKFYLQAQLTFVVNIWIDWYRFDYGLFQLWHYPELLLYFPNIFGECCVCGVALVFKWHPVVVKTLFEITFCNT